jgi:phospholipase D-like protein
LPIGRGPAWLGVVLAATTATWVFVLLPLIAIWIAGIVDIVQRDLDRGAKAGWIIIVLLLPVLGMLLYFLTRKPSEREIEAAQAASRDLAARGRPHHPGSDADTLGSGPHAGSG